MRAPRRRTLLSLALALSGLLAGSVAALVAANLLVTARGGRAIVAGPESAPSATVAIVLGARVYPDGSPSPMLADRLEIGVELYRSGRVRKLLLSGDHGRAPYDEANAMRRWVLARGVPAEDVFTDHAGFSTFDTMARARDVFQVRDALVVTQPFHLERAVYTARALGIAATGVPADQHEYPAETRRMSRREWFARAKALAQLHLLGSRPALLGPPIPIEGDGRATLG